MLVEIRLNLVVIDIIKMLTINRCNWKKKLFSHGPACSTMCPAERNSATGKRGFF